LGRRVEECVTGRLKRNAGKYTGREGGNSLPELVFLLPYFFPVLQGKYNLPIWKIVFFPVLQGKYNMPI
jgi:hypothetical protein